MNKKNIMLILTGIIIQLFDFTVRFGTARVDISNDILAYALILIGIIPLVSRNNLFKKSRKHAIFGIIISVLLQMANLVDLGAATGDFDTFSKGLQTIIIIYFTYYFSESIMLEAKMQDKAALTRNFRFTWAVLGIFIFMHYASVFLDKALFEFGTLAVVIISALFYSSSILTACLHLYTDEMPKLGR